MRSLHRWLTIVFAPLLLFVALSGLMIEAVDLYVLLGFSAHPETELGSINGGSRFLDPRFVSLAPGVPWPDAGQTPLPDTLSPRLAAALRGLGAGAVDAVDWRMPRLTIDFTSRPPLILDSQGAAIALPAGAAPPPGGTIGWHDFIKSFHAGRVAGAGGSWAILATGLALLLLSLSGLWVYGKMWLGRIALGRAAPLWRGANEPLLWRGLHRLTSLFAFLFVAYLATTGTLLALDDIVVRFSPIYTLLRTPLPIELGRATPAPIRASDIAATLIRVRASAGNAAPGLPVLGIALTPGQDAQAIIGGAHPVDDLFNPRTGLWTNRADPAITQQSPYVGSMRYHSLLQHLHTGALLGLGGRWVIVAADVSLLYLAISGLVMYLQMKLRRRRPGWFW